MANLQRVVLVLGVLAALAVTFVWPPKYVQARGTRMSIEQCVGTGSESVRQDCLKYANQDGSLLLAYLLAIGGATAGLVYATRPRT